MPLGRLPKSFNMIFALFSLLLLKPDLCASLPDSVATVPERDSSGGLFFYALHFEKGTGSEYLLSTFNAAGTLIGTVGSFDFTTFVEKGVEDIVFDGYGTCAIPECIDNKSYCTGLSALGICFTHAYFMDIDCQKSCDNCPEGKTSQVHLKCDTEGSALAVTEDACAYNVIWTDPYFCDLIPPPFAKTETVEDSNGAQIFYSIHTKAAGSELVIKKLDSTGTFLGNIGSFDYESVLTGNGAVTFDGDKGVCENYLCKDDYKYCASLAPLGLCTSEEDFMSVQCMKSCDTCPEASSTVILQCDVAAAKSLVITEDSCRYNVVWTDPYFCNKR